MAGPITTVGSIAASRAEGQPTSAAAKADADFDAFLQLLTAQMRNQDPLKPLDSTQFVEQLASFSTVEQQIQTNDKLDTLLGAQTEDDLGAMASWIGKTVVGEGVGMEFTGEPLTIEVPGDPNAERASVVIRDSEGRDIIELPAKPAGGELRWDGALRNGGTAEPGVYSVDYVYGADGRDPWTVPAEGAGRVVEARRGEDGPTLILESGAILSLSQVRSVAEDSEAPL